MNATPMTVYSGHTTNWTALVLTAAAGLPLIVLGLSSGDTSTAAMIPLAVIVLLLTADMVTTSSVRVTVGTRNLRVRFGVFGWPRFSYAIERIARVEEVELSTWSAAWGICWTFRDGLRLTLRTGPALRLTLTNGRRVTVNVEDAGAAIAALEAAGVPHPGSA